MTASLAEYAQTYHAAGLAPIRIKPNSKRPTDANWTTDRHDAAALDTMFSNHTGNIGITFPPEIFALDIDCKGDVDGRATLSAWELQLGPLPPTRTQITPSGGEHRLFRLPPGTTLRNGVGVAPGLDIRTAGGQIVVAPSVIDGKAYRWVNPEAPIADIPPAWLPLLRGAEQALAAKIPLAGTEGDSIPEGARNATLFDKAATMRRAGFAVEEICVALHGLNARCCAPMLPDSEVDTIVASAAKGQPAPEPWQVGFGQAPLPPGALPVPPVPPAPARAARISLSDLHSAPPAPQRFLIEGLLPAGVLTLLGAHGGAGKSMLALTAAVCLAAGRPFMGKRAEKCRVLFYSGEDETPVVRRRLRKICLHMGVDPFDLDAGLLALNATDDPILYGAGRTTPAYSSLQADVAEWDPGVIIIDNASDVFDSNEIERARVREFVRLLVALGKRRDAAILLLAHVDKQTARNRGSSEGYSKTSSEGYSGSTAWHNSARSRLFLTSDGRRATLEQQKNNHGPFSAPIHLAWTDEGLLAVADAPGGADDKAAVLRLLTEAHSMGVEVSPAWNTQNSAWGVLHLLPEFPQALKRDGLKAIVTALTMEGAIETVEIMGKNRKYKNVIRPTAPGALGLRSVDLAH